MKRLLILFAAGCLGALANSLLVWLSGDLGITRSMGVSIAPALTPNWLYPRIVWGGIWGLVVYPACFEVQTIGQRHLVESVADNGPAVRCFTISG